jgi:YgiT-type zinc finger domain-containing protein
MECFYCKGRMMKSNAPFSADRNGYHISWESVLAWVCTQCGEAFFEEAGSRYFCESFFGHPCPTSGKNHATANAFGGPSRPASLVAYPARGMQHSYAMTRRDVVKPAFSLRCAP